MDSDIPTRKPHAQATVWQAAYETTHQTVQANGHPLRRITASEVRELSGGISDMTLWRWMHKEDLKFPRPIYIGRRRYWRETEVLEWLDAQPQQAD